MAKRPVADGNKQFLWQRDREREAGGTFEGKRKTGTEKPRTFEKRERASASEVFVFLRWLSE